MIEPLFDHLATVEQKAQTTKPKVLCQKNK